MKIGFFGLETPEAQTKANPKLIQGLKFLAGADRKELYDCAAAQVADLKPNAPDHDDTRAPTSSSASRIWALMKAPSPTPLMIWPRTCRASISSSTATPTPS